MSQEYLEMRGKELLIDGIVIAEVTNIEDAIAISDRVSNYVDELQRKIADLEKQLKLVARVKVEDGTAYCLTSGWPISDCCCDDCDPDFEYHGNPDEF